MSNAVIILVLPEREPFSHSVPAALGLTGLLYGRSFTGPFPNIISISTKKTLSPNPLPSSLSEHCPTIPFTLYLNTITTKHPTPLPSGLPEQRPLQLLFSQEEKPGDADERRLKGDDGHRKGAGP